MKTLTRSFWAALVLLFLAWWITDQTDFSQLTDFFAWRKPLMQASGVVLMGVMSLAMILAVRPLFLERRLGGLDKLYRLHKWLGISALILSLGHWLLAQGPKWLVGLGWLTRPARHGRPPLPDGSWQQMLQHLHGPAEQVGEWAFYAAALLMVLALMKYFPYRRFFQTHRLFPLVYLALVFHSVVLLKADYWSGPAGLVMALLMLLGTGAALLTLFGHRVGQRPVTGKILALEAHPESGVLNLDIQVPQGWRGHQAGQFAYLTFHHGEGAHPFTISSAWHGDGRLSFMIKALGDYTRRLPQALAVGDPVRVEGPYGHFTFDGKPRQIWVGAGIGITPFLARLDALSTSPAPNVPEIDLFHPTAAYDPSAVARLTQAAAKAGVKLHLLWEQRDGRLDVERLCQVVPDWQQAELWFCGPQGFGKALATGLAARGFNPGRFHQELFAMR